MRSLFILLCGATLPACTYAVVSSESKPPHCAEAGDCAAGFACNVAKQ